MVSKKKTEEVKQSKEKELAYLPSLKDLLEAGAHFGHSTKRRNPKMDEFIYTIKNGVQIFDLVKTREQLEKACRFLEKTAAEGGAIMFLGTKGQAAELVKTEAERTGVYYVANRWVGGLFTNWTEIKKRIEKLSSMREKMEAGDYKKYTKKEQVLLRREIERLSRMYGGLVGLKELPQVLVIVDPNSEITAYKEAVATNVKMVAMLDSNADPEGIAYPVPANDDASKAVKLVVEAFFKAVEEGKKKQKKGASK